MGQKSRSRSRFQGGIGSRNGIGSISGISSKGLGRIDHRRMDNVQSIIFSHNMLQIIKITYFEYQIKKCQVILLIVMDSILLAVEPIPGNGVDSSEKQPDPESS